MAVDAGFLGDATSGIGQGLAYVLPQSRTEAYAMQLNQEAAKQRRAAAALLAKQKQAEQEAYANQLANLKIPEHNVAWSNKINGDWKSMVDDAANQWATTGKNPLTTPEFINRRNAIQSMAGDSNQYGQAYVRLKTALDNDHDNKIDPAAKAEGYKWLDAYDKNPLEGSKLPIPTLNARGYDIGDMEKLMKPTPKEESDGTLTVTTPFRSGHVEQAQHIMADPKFAEFNAKNGINQGLIGAFTLPNKKGGIYYPTNDNDVDKLTGFLIANKNDPHVLETFKAAGINPDDPHVDLRLKDAIIKQNTNEGRVVSGLADYADSKVGPKRIYKPPFTAYELYEMGQKKANGEKEPTYYQDLAERMRTGVPGSGEELSAYFANNPNYLNGLTIDKTNPKQIKITVPTKYKTDPKELVTDENGKPVNNSDRVMDEAAHTYTLDSTNPVQFAAGLAQIYKLGTGESVVPTKGLTTSGKGKVKGGLDPVRKTTPAGTPLDNKHKKAATDYGL